MYSGPDAWSWCTNAVNSCVLLFWRPLIYMILMAWHRHNFTQALAEYLNISSLILNKLKTQQEASDHNGLINKHWKFVLFCFFNSRPLSIETFSCAMLRLHVHRSVGYQQISCFSSAWMLLRGVHVWSTGTAYNKKLYLRRQALELWLRCFCRVDRIWCLFVYTSKKNLFGCSFSQTSS